MSQDKLKQAAAEMALDYVVDGQIVGVGTGSTARFFIDALARIKTRIIGAVASSEDTRQRLEAHGIEVFELNEVVKKFGKFPVYIDGADEITAQMHMIKGGGAALTREKIVAAVAEKFVCMVDASKYVEVLGNFPLPIEVIPMASEQIARELATLEEEFSWLVPPKTAAQTRSITLRKNCLTDNGNVILDVHGWQISNPVALETRINQIVGVVSNGLFARRPADICLLAHQNGVDVRQSNLLA